MGQVDLFVSPQWWAVINSEGLEMVKGLHRERTEEQF